MGTRMGSLSGTRVPTGNGNVFYKIAVSKDLLAVKPVPNYTLWRPLCHRNLGASHKLSPNNLCVFHVQSGSRSLAVSFSLSARLSSRSQNLLNCEEKL